MWGHKLRRKRAHQSLLAAVPRHRQGLAAAQRTLATLPTATAELREIRNVLEDTCAQVVRCLDAIERQRAQPGRPAQMLRATSEPLRRCEQILRAVRQTPQLAEARYRGYVDVIATLHVSVAELLAFGDSAT